MTVIEILKQENYDIGELYDYLEYECIEIESDIIDQRRWCTVYEKVVKDSDGKYYGYRTDSPSTECQDFEVESDFHFDGEVYPVEEHIVVTKYYPVKES